MLQRRTASKIYPEGRYVARRAIQISPLIHEQFCVNDRSDPPRRGSRIAGEAKPLFLARIAICYEIYYEVRRIPVKIARNVPDLSTANHVNMLDPPDSRYSRGIHTVMREW